MQLLGITSPKIDISVEKKAVLRETLLNKEFMEIKDFYYNIGKSICIPTVMESKVHRPRFLALFMNFIDNEYAALHFSKHSLSNVNEDSSLLDKMTYANMIDSEQYRKYRRQAYSKLYCFLELL